MNWWHQDLHNHTSLWTSMEPILSCLASISTRNEFAEGKTVLSWLHGIFSMSSRNLRLSFPWIWLVFQEPGANQEEADALNSTTAKYVSGLSKHTTNLSACGHCLTWLRTQYNQWCNNHHWYNQPTSGIIGKCYSIILWDRFACAI